MITLVLNETTIILPAAPSAPTYVERVVNAIIERKETLEHFEIHQEGLSSEDWVKISAALNECKNLKKLILPTLTEIAATQNLSRVLEKATLMEVSVPKANKDLRVLLLSKQIVRQKDSLTEITIPDTDFTDENWASVFNALSNCGKLEKLILPNLKHLSYSWAPAVIAKPTLKEVSMPNADKDSRVMLCKNQFSKQQDSLTQVTITDTDFNVDDWYQIFSALKNVKNLSSISLPTLKNYDINSSLTEVLKKPTLTDINLPRLSSYKIASVLEILSKRNDGNIKKLKVGDPSHYGVRATDTEIKPQSNFSTLITILNKNHGISSVDMRGHRFASSGKAIGKPAMVYYDYTANEESYRNISDVKSITGGKRHFYLSADFFLTNNSDKNNYTLPDKAIEGIDKFLDQTILHLDHHHSNPKEKLSYNNYFSLHEIIEKSQSLYELDFSGTIFSQTDGVSQQEAFDVFEMIMMAASVSLNLRVVNFSNCGLDAFLLKQVPLMALYKMFCDSSVEEIDLSGNKLSTAYFYNGVEVEKGYLPPSFWDFLEPLVGTPASPAKEYRFDKANFLNNLMRSTKLKVINLERTGITYDDVKGLIKDNLHELTIVCSTSTGETKRHQVRRPLHKVDDDLAKFLGLAPNETELAHASAAGSSSMGGGGAQNLSASAEKEKLRGKEAVAIFESTEAERSRDQAQQRRAAYAASQSATAAVAAASTAGERLIEDMELPPSYLQAIAAANMELPESSPTTEVLVLPTPSAPPMPTAAITVSQSDATEVTAVATSTTAVAPAPVARPRTQTMVERFVTNPLTSILGGTELDVPRYIVTRNGTRIEIDDEGNPVVPSNIPTADQIREGATQRATPAAPAQTRTRARAN